MKYRIEQDSMGEVQVPEGAYYGAQTQRAKENFTVSTLRLPACFIQAIALIKQHAAQVNKELGLLDAGLAQSIVTAATEVLEGKLADQFVVDVFQTGSGTSTNMNVNEVVAGRANELLTGKRGGKFPVHPNDHVNLGQSSNDVIPSAIHIAALLEIKTLLLPALDVLHKELEKKSEAFRGVRKIGRTHLQDAVPMTLGQEFSGYARQVELGVERLQGVEKRLSELALGGTAVGNGLNTHPEFAARVVAAISRETGLAFQEAKNHFEAQAAQDAVVETSGILKTIAVSLTKIANDVRWLASGPRCGIGEITIPSLQPGSSIMPGKVNPVIPEMVLQVSAQVIGNDAAITQGGQTGNFELNVMLPLMAYALIQSIRLLAEAARALAEKCIRGIEANVEKCASNLEQSLALATAFVPLLGYDRAASLAKEAYEKKKTIREVALEKRVLSEEEIRKILDEIVGKDETI
ncbi:MAG: class II fumarate hydratase [Desulfobacterota bacterium]|jgi:fumarate hydratase class II|nr:class II fumarate hydratase [Thermodesulfobacteriota bacterium]